MRTTPDNQHDPIQHTTEQGADTPGLDAETIPAFTPADAAALLALGGARTDLDEATSRLTRAHLAHQMTEGQFAMDDAQIDPVDPATLRDGSARLGSVLERQPLILPE